MHNKGGEDFLGVLKYPGKITHFLGDVKVCIVVCVVAASMTMGSLQQEGLKEINR